MDDKRLIRLKVYWIQNMKLVLVICKSDYTNKYGGLSLKSNLSVFQSYSDGDLSNWTFTNSFAYTIWNGLGLGFELGLRNNKQEALNNAVNLNNALAAPLTQPTFSTVDNKLQSYWLFGLSYAL